jgi:hypothetical protein
VALVLPAVAACGSAGSTVAHGEVTTACQNAGTLLVATGDSGAVVGSGPLASGQPTSAGSKVCNLSFSFSVKSSSTYTFDMPDGVSGLSGTGPVQFIGTTTFTRGELDAGIGLVAT